MEDLQLGSAYVLTASNESCIVIWTMPKHHQEKNILGTYYLRIWCEILIKDGLRTKSMKMLLDKLQDVPR